VNDWGYDLNLRHVHMKAKYGVDPQFPITRYVNGLTSQTVPDRSGEYPQGTSAYQGMNDCTNPLYAGELPDGSKTDVASLCHLAPGLRTKDLVFFAHIGGVPNQLLHFKPGDPKASTLTSADWVKILGANSIPPNYDYTGIDPHMIESYQPRPNIAPPGSSNTAYPYNGHDWITDTGMGHILQVDREYACTFDLVDQTGTPAPRDCTLQQNQNFCDCPRATGTLTPEQLPPICNSATPTQQTGAKAYPTIRELEVAKLMGDHGVVSSICPIHVAEVGTGDPLYGYRPAMSLLVDRMGNALQGQCLSQALTVQSGGGVPCWLFAQLPSSAGGSCMNPVCDATLGLAVPPMSELTKFCQTAESAYVQYQASLDGGIGAQDPAKQSVCALHQLNPKSNPIDFSNGSCLTSKEPGWCYVTGAAAGRCAQAILFSQGEPPMGAAVSLQCP
jgi:hypothetical protein